MPSVRLLLVVAFVLLSSATGRAQYEYPRVYGPTGRLYGPTQAHYQYMRQYGRPWHGYRGLSGGYQSGAQVDLAYGGITLPGAYGYGYGSGFGYSPYGFGGFGGVGAWPYGVGSYGYTSYGSLGGATFGAYGGPGYMYPSSPFAYPGGDPYGYYYEEVIQPPFVVPSAPGMVLENPIPADPVDEALARGRELLPAMPADPEDLALQTRPSTPEARLKSLRYQDQGDAHFKQQNYAQAYLRYKNAVEAAEDLAEPRFRLAWTLLAVGRYETALREIRRGLALDPTWPVTGKTLDEIFGEENQLAKSSIKNKLALWVQENLRDPDRLFLLGVVTHFDGDPRSSDVFEAAELMGGGDRHVLAFQSAAPRTAPLELDELGDPDIELPQEGEARPALPPVPAP